MAGKPPVKRKDPFADTGAGDPLPEVAAQLEARQRRRQDLARQDQKTARQAARRRRPNLTADVPLSLLEAFDDLAERESVCKSDLVVLALARLFADLDAGDLDLQGLKLQARSLRYDYKLDIAPTWEQS
jgi:hypothetical protein